MTDFNPTITPLVYTKNEVDSLINKSTNDINGIKGTIETADYNTFCTTKEGNDIFKEVYIYPYVEIRDVKDITINKDTNGLYQITFLNSENKYSYVYLGNDKSVEEGEVVSGEVEGEGFAVGATFYAVIDWYRIPEKSSKTISTNFTSLIDNSKYSPIITHVMQSYKFVKGSLGNAFIRELYLEDLRREEYENGALVSVHAYSFSPSIIPKEFMLSDIERNYKGRWVINFGAKYGGEAYPFKFETTENPESKDVIKGELLSWIDEGKVQYKATMYAVVDWTQIPDGTSVRYGRPLLGGVVQKRLSPIICTANEDVEWSDTFNLNDYKTQGVYNISGERLSSDDNLPITNAASGHSISGQLTVLDASLSDAERCVTQYLKLTNRLGKEGKEYIRTYNRFKDSREEWSLWRELKGTMNLDQISEEELNNYTENGTYEGVINNNDASSAEQIVEKINSFLTALERGNTATLPTGTFFTMEVLNNYAVAKYITQITGGDLPKTIIQRAKCVFPTSQYIEIYRMKVGDEDFDAWSKIK